MNMYLCKLQGMRGIQGIRGILSGKLMVAMMLALFLIACTVEDEEKEEEKKEAAQIPDTTIAVQALSIIPNSESVTLKWKNPSATITRIAISWTPVEPGVLQPVIIESDNLTASLAEVTQTIVGLSNDITYTFTITPLLGGADADKNSRVRPEPISRLVGPNQDGDEFADKDPAELDIDGDNILNDVDPDDDNDGTPDESDAFPKDRSEQVDTDEDGVGDNADAFPEIKGVSVDTDGDGIDNNADSDDDNDTVDDIEDAYPLDNESYEFKISNLRIIPSANSATLQWNNPPAHIREITIRYTQTSGSGGSEESITDSRVRAIKPSTVISDLITNTNYRFIITPILADVDGAPSQKRVATVTAERLIGPNRDGDELADNDPAEDYDNDEILNAVDPDDDNDQVNDTMDAFPYDSTEQSDADGDGTGDNADMDDDNDGTIDVNDAFPEDASEQADIDGDGIGDNGDVDDDNDGLIEINSAERLNQVRYNLYGTSLKTSGDDGGNDAGCGNGTIVGEDITVCSGYELTANIDLSTYENWVPISDCFSSGNCPNTFRSIFDGNNAIISGITINAEAGTEKIGLFGAIGPNAILRNIRIRDASIQGGANDVGILAGSAHDSQIISISLLRGEITSPAANSVGGLVGKISVSSITSSYVRGTNVNGDDKTGGLLGMAEAVNIISSYAAASNIIGGDNTGGLFGKGKDVSITSSYAAASSIIGGDNTGGLLGNVDKTEITSSYATDSSVTGDDNTGGLLGNVDRTVITSSYTTENSIIGVANTGGLVGSATNANITSSYASKSKLLGRDNIGGMLGNAISSIVNLAYATESNVSGINNIGGLFGSADNVNMTYSYVEEGIVNGDEGVGGLVGNGANGMITSSYALGIITSGLNKIGGLIGDGANVIINSSYVAGSRISGEDDVGGLAGYGEQMTVYSSYAAGGNVTGTNNVGGLLGSGLLSQVDISYAAVSSVIGDSNVGGLIGRTATDDGIMPAVVDYSYWDINITGLGDRPGVSNAQEGEAKTTIELSNQTNFAGIYAAWGVAECLDANQVKVKSWHLGDNLQRPALNCVPEGIKNQINDDDGDGTPNGFDAFPNNPDEIADADGDGTGDNADPDDDNDNTNDTMDAFPFDPNEHADADGDKIGNNADPDDDNDGFPDTEDIFPFNASEHADYDKDGIGDIADLDENNDNVTDTGPDNDGDYVLDSVDTDDDNDGFPDTQDHLPFDANEHVDADGDSIGDIEDVDDDNNGLIEIATADQLDKIRYDLTGASFKTSPGDSGNSAGCNGNRISECNGYELTADIDLGYNEWQPIGDCTANNVCHDAFNSIFDGNKRTISNLVINADSNANGVGLFGAISPTSTLQNINIQDATVTGGLFDVGVLAGFLRHATIINSSLSQGEVDSGGSSVGGLVGDAGSATIISSSVIDVTVSGDVNFIGGLAGDTREGSITNSFATNVTVRGGSNIGGLVGYMANGDITKSYTTNTHVSGSGSAGSLTGNIAIGNVIHSYANNFYVTSNNEVGGLIGTGRGSTITSSYATEGTVIGIGGHTGGLVGYALGGEIFTSYAKDISITSKSTSPISGIGGLIGTSGNIIASYTINTTLVGANNRGGLVGFAIDSSIYKIDYSYAAPAPLQPASNVGGLVGNTLDKRYLVTDSYWDNQTSGIANRSDVLDMHEGEGRNTADLQTPVDFTGIYANWANLWCDPDTGEFTSDSGDELALRLRDGEDVDALDSYRVWDLGFDDEYPILTCGP